MAETYESKINREPVQGWTRRTVADGDYLQSKTIQPLVNRDSILAKGLDDTNTLVNGMSNKVDNVETKCDAQEALVKSLSGDVEDFCTSATEAFEQIKTNEQTLAGNVETIQQSFNTLSGDVWQMNFMGFKDSTTVFVKEEIEQGKHMFSFSSVGGGGGGTSYDMAWYPTVDSTGKIEWAWNPTTSAPPTANIKGPKGENGTNGTNGTNGADGADACPISAKSTDIENGHNVKIFYTSAANPDTNPLADFNVLDGQDGSDIKFDTGTNATMSGTGEDNTPYGVNTDVLATQTWVENQHYIANVNTTAFSGDGTFQNPLDLKINNPNTNKKYGYKPGTGWTEISEGGSTSVETDNWISGDGTSNKPIGLSAEAASAIEAMADQYQIDGGQYVSVVPNSTTHKVVVGLDNQATNAIADVIASASVWDEASAVSAKSYASINNQQVITTVNQGVSASLSAVQYVPNTAFQGAAPKLMFVVEDDDDLLAKVNGGACSGKGALFFVCSAIG